MRIRLRRSAIAVAACSLVSLASAADSGGISGSVTARGLRSNADIVVSLQAEKVTVAPPEKAVDLDQNGMQFIPRVLPVVKGTTVRFLNSEAMPHNVFSPEAKYDLGIILKGQTREYKFDKPGVYTQLCAMHPEMVAYVMVLDTPYFGVTDDAGRFEIKDVPSGKYTLVTWGERLKQTARPVTVESGRTLMTDVALSR